MSHGNKNVKKASIPFLAASQQVAFCAVFRNMRNSPLLLPRSVVPWPEFHPPLTNPYCSVALRSHGTSRGVESGSNPRESCLSSLEVSYSLCVQFLESRGLAAFLGATTHWRS